MQYLLGFGNTMQTVAIDDRCIKAILLPNPVATSIDSEEEVLRGLRSPASAFAWGQDCDCHKRYHQTDAVKASASSRAG